MEASLYLTRSEEGKQTSVYIHIRYTSVKFKYYLTEKIDPQFWNAKEQRAKKTNRFPGYMEFNRRLDKIQDKVKDLYNAFRNNHAGKEPNPGKFRELLDKEFKAGPEKAAKTFIPFFEEITDASLNGARVQHKTGKPFTYNTVKGYVTAINHLKDFEQARKRKLGFDDINVEFHADFTEFLIKKYQLGPNSIGKDFKNIKMAMNEAAERGLTTNTQFKSKRFTVTKENTASIYLSEQELDDLQAMDLSSYSKLERVRDLFIVGCYTGLRFSDLSTLTPRQIKDGLITITQTKTGGEVVIPVHPMVQQIMNKYNGQLPAAISNQKTNDYLKEIGQLSPTLDIQVAKSFTKAGAKVSRNFKKWELLSTHTARRSFATNEFLAGTPVELIMRLTGHKDTATFYRYLRLTPTEHAQKVRDLWASRNQMKAI